MIYLSVFWGIFIVFLLGYYLSKKFNFKKIHSFLDNYSMLIMIVLLSLSVIAIVTKDPITLAGIEIPTELQWLGSLIVSGFGAWRFYLDPLKKKVYGMDRELGRMDISTKSLNSKVDALEGNLGSKIDFIQKDLSLIKDKLIKGL